jgi:hypothetical protein
VGGGPLSDIVRRDVFAISLMVEKRFVMREIRLGERQATIEMHGRSGRARMHKNVRLLFALPALR